MGQGGHVVYSFLAFNLFVIIAGCVWETMVRDVARLSPPKTNRPLRNLIEAHRVSRVWREHRRLFPNSKRRRFVLLFDIAAALCLILLLFLN